MTATASQAASADAPFPGPRALVAATIAIGGGLRWLLWPWGSGDWYWGWRVWHEKLAATGFAGFAEPFYEYSPPWPYMVWLLTRLDGGGDGFTAVKLTLMAFDLALATLAHRLVREIHPAGRRPLIAFCAVLLAPTVVMNAGVVMQCDGIYVGFLLLSVLATMRRRPLGAWTAFGVAISFKLQAIFLAPFLLAVVLRRRLALWPAPVVPLVYLLALVPAWLAGRPFADLALAYATQSNAFVTLSAGAPNLYALIDDRHYAFGYGFGLVIATVVALGYARAVQTSRRPLDAETLLHCATVACAILPFILPKMHDRYFFASDVLAIALAAANPAYVVAAVALQIASALAYLPWNFGFGEALIPAVLINALTVPWLAARLAARLHPRLEPSLAPLLAPAALARALAALVPAWAAWSFGLGTLTAAGWDVADAFGRTPSDLPGLVGFAALWALGAVALRRAGPRAAFA